MSEPRNDRVPDDPQVRQAYRALPDESVPAELDRRVLENARSAIDQPLRSRWPRWSAPVAAAASVLVVIAIALDPSAREAAKVAAPAQAPVAVVAQERLDSASSFEQAQAPKVQEKQESDARRVTTSPSPSTTREAKPSPPREEVRVMARRRQESLQEVPVPISSLSDSSAPEAASEPASLQSRSASNASDKVSARTGRVPPPPPAAAPADQATHVTSALRRESERASSNDGAVAEAIAKADTVTPMLKARLSEIEKLRRDGNLAAADRAIEQLRKEYPALNVEAELRALEQPSEPLP
jgi:hypothetical protein